MKAEYSDPYGTWEVTTEGDVEGRTMVKIGVYTGFLDEIAFHLADKCYYSLTFKKITPTNTDLTPTGDKVSVRFAYDADINKLSMIERETLFSEILKDRNITVDNSSYYNSVKLISTDGKTKAINNALAKLTEEEKKLLGLK